MLVAARIRPRKYDSSSRTGKSLGIKERVDAAGSLDPCFDKRLSAGGRHGECGGGGVRYRDKRVW
jgi:hypothetical protein